MDEQQNIIIYRTADGKASVALYAKDGKIWLNRQGISGAVCQGRQDMAEPAADGRTFCHLKAKYQHAYS